MQVGPTKGLRDFSRPILLKKSRRVFCRRKSVSDVEIWLGQKAKLSWFLRSNAEIERFSSSREEALSETDFFNRIGQKETFRNVYLLEHFGVLCSIT